MRRNLHNVYLNIECRNIEEWMNILDLLKDEGFNFHNSLKSICNIYGSLQRHYLSVLFNGLKQNEQNLIYFCFDTLGKSDIYSFKEQITLSYDEFMEHGSVLSVKNYYTSVLSMGLF